MTLYLGTVLRIRIRDPVLFYPLDPGSGMNFFRIPDPEGMFFWRDFLKNPCSFIFLLIKLVPETIRSKKKVGLIRDPDPDEKFRDPDTGSGIKTSRIRNTGSEELKIPNHVWLMRF
jgi:hypothetical protein